MNPPMTQMKTVPPDKEAIRAYAREVGFDVVRFTKAETRAETRAWFADFLAQGQHGDMAWMQNNADRRADPKTLWPEARSVVMVGLNYGPDSDPRDVLADPTAAGVSVYAQNRD